MLDRRAGIGCGGRAAVPVTIRRRGLASLLTGGGPELPCEDRRQDDDERPERLSALTNACPAHRSDDRPGSHRASLAGAQDATQEGAQTPPDPRSARIRRPVGRLPRVGEPPPPAQVVELFEAVRVADQLEVGRANGRPRGIRSSPDHSRNTASGRAPATCPPILPAKLVPSIVAGARTPVRSRIVGARSTIETSSSRAPGDSPGACRARGTRTHASYGHVLPSHRCSPKE